MNREPTFEEVTELAVASHATRGNFVSGDDQEGGKQPQPGLTDD